MPCLKIHTGSRSERTDFAVSGAYHAVAEINLMMPWQLVDESLQIFIRRHDSSLEWVQRARPNNVRQLGRGSRAVTYAICRNK
jgi:hypothetical protein